jgi:hypothetical protein
VPLGSGILYGQLCLKRNPIVGITRAWVVSRSWYKAQQAAWRWVKPGGRTATFNRRRRDDDVLNSNTKVPRRVVLTRVCLEWEVVRQTVVGSIECNKDGAGGKILGFGPPCNSGLNTLGALTA